ncbi:thioredoxin family protein [Clostridium guangxiense]
MTKVENTKEIMKYGVMRTPAIVVNKSYRFYD